MPVTTDEKADPSHFALLKVLGQERLHKEAFKGNISSIFTYLKLFKTIKIQCPNISVQKVVQFFTTVTIDVFMLEIIPLRLEDQR